MRDIVEKSIKRVHTYLGNLCCECGRENLDKDRCCIRCCRIIGVLILGVRVDAQRYCWGVFSCRLGGFYNDETGRFLSLLRCAHCGKLVETRDRSCSHDETGRVFCSVTINESDRYEIHTKMSPADYPPIDDVLIEFCRSSYLAISLRFKFLELSESEPVTPSISVIESHQKPIVHSENRVVKSSLSAAERVLRSGQPRSTYYRHTRQARTQEKDRKKAQACKWHKQGIKKEIIAGWLEIDLRTLRRWLTDK